MAFPFHSRKASKMLMKQIMEEQKLKGIRVLATGVAHNFNNMLVGYWDMRPLSA